jgi:hypothetical protein
VKNLIACLLLTLFSFVFIPHELKATGESVRTELINDSTVVKNKLARKLGEITGIEKQVNFLKERKSDDKKMSRHESRGIISAVFFIAIGAVIAFIVIMVFLV